MKRIKKIVFFNHFIIMWTLILSLTLFRLAYFWEWGGGADSAPPGISGDNAHTRLCFTSFLTNFWGPIQWKKNWVPLTPTRSSIRTPRFMVSSLLWRITNFKAKFEAFPVIRIKKIEKQIINLETKQNS